MGLQHKTFKSLPDLIDVVVHLVNNTSNVPGAMTWTGRTEELLVLLYAFLEEFDEIPVESVLTWGQLQSVLISKMGNNTADSLESWLNVPATNPVILNAGSNENQFSRMAEEIRKSIVATISP